MATLWALQSGSTELIHRNGYDECDLTRGGQHATMCMGQSTFEELGHARVHTAARLLAAFGALGSELEESVPLERANGTIAIHFLPWQ